MTSRTSPSLIATFHFQPQSSTQCPGSKTSSRARDSRRSRALALAEHAIEQGFDKDRLPTELTFFYLPFEHSENLENQHRSVALRSALPEHNRKAEAIEHAVRHKEVFERFGRYPHRNAVLGRISTEDEIEFLKTADDNWIKSQIPANEESSDA